MDRLLAAQVFVSVVEHGSFAGAAERLDASTSSVSRHVSDLEAHLGARLLNRTTRRLSLTEAGRTFFERSRELLAEWDDAEQMISQSSASAKGTLRITSSIAFGMRRLAPLLAEFVEAQPAIKLDVSLSDRFVDLVEEGFDLAIRIGEISAPNLVARKIGDSHMVTCASASYLAKRGTPRHPQDLVAHECLIYEYMSSKTVWTFRDKRGKASSVRVSGKVQSNSGSLLAAMAVAGGGIAAVPEFMVDDALRSGDLVALFSDLVPQPLPIYAVYATRRHLAAKVRVFIDFVATGLVLDKTVETNKSARSPARPKQR